MNRQIKFRVWNKVRGEMFESAIYNAPDSFDMILKHPQVYVPMQYTGLHDKNSKEVYEGDIVKMHYFSEEFASDLGVLEKDNTITGDIQYRQDFATYVVNTKDQDYTISEYCQEPSEELEVIGNIYEYPHLLQDKA